ncbi:hypothetical protein BAUCODRAFT_25047 [Baudoinia panamericana UAMH 10762]|uniref:Elongin-A n=1 Tax=Baudoinia panamericana (strain UAMH 10762) TaxID=717646 RepID=M2NAE8_BAUPA|nr:uncharacterized protein BAUCODRAFT_25047 [Baudoinia panamericana UAMH 10762]EMC96104.1 hypothetical protein BAUCODRAFT_25047 [Baudoinia panamericana UAMH 10762]
MPAPSLRSLAIRSCIRHLPDITSVGEIPYSVLRPVLRRIENPSHLRTIEVSSPHVADADEELWKAFIARDIPGWEKKLAELGTPRNARSWWKVYRRLVREEKEAREKQEERLREAMSGLTKQREDANVSFVGKVVPMKEKGRAFVDGVRNPKANGWGGVVKPSVKRGRDVVAALRNQSRQAVREREYNLGQKRTFTTVPPPGTKGKVQAAPEWMVQELKKPALAKPVPAAGEGVRREKIAVPRVFTASKGHSRVDAALSKAEGQSNAEKEARLRALTQAKSRVPVLAAAPLSPPIMSGQDRKAEELNEPEQLPGVGRLGIEPTGERRPSHAPTTATQAMRKRAAPAASPFMPAKRKRG